MTGIVYAILAMISYSSTATFTQLAYRVGMSTWTLLFSRHLVSLVFILPLALRKEVLSTVGKKQIPGLLLLSGASIVGNLLFNHAYRYLPNMVSVSVTLSYIVLVFVIEILLGRERFSGRRGLIILTTVIGIVVIAIPGLGGSFSMSAFGIGLLAALQYSLQIVFLNSKLMKQVSTYVILLTGIIPIMIFSSIRCAMSGEPLLPAGGAQWAVMLWMGTVGVIVARGLFYRSTRLIGATKASVIDSAEPFASALLGFFILGQSISSYTVIGSVFMVASILLLLREKSGTPGSPSAAQQ